MPATRRKKTTRRRKTAVGSVPKTRKFGGKTYRHKMCSTSKRNAEKAAKSHRAKGKSKGARVVKTGGKYCVYTKG